MYQISGWVMDGEDRRILFAYANSHLSAEYIAELFRSGGYERVTIKPLETE